MDPLQATQDCSMSFRFFQEIFLKVSFCYFQATSSAYYWLILYSVSQVVIPLILPLLLITVTGNLEFCFSSNLCQLCLICDQPVVSSGGNRSTRRKPPPNPKSLATFSHAPNGCNRDLILGCFSSHLCQLWLICDEPVVRSGGNRSTQRKPLPNPNSPADM